MRARLGALRQDLHAHKTELRTFAGEVGGMFRGAAGGIVVFNQGLDLANRGLHAVDATLGRVIRKGVEFESAFAGVRKTVNATEEQFRSLERGILAMSVRMPFAASSIADVEAAAGQLGIKAKDISGFTETMIRLGVTTNLSATNAATAIARFANITGLAAKDVDRFGSTIVALGNTSATTEAEIVEMARRIAGAGATIGVTTPAILGIAAALSSVGIEAELGGSAVTRAMLAMSKAVQSGGKDLADFGKVAFGNQKNAGGAFAQLFRERPDQAFSKFVEGVGKLGQGSFNVLERLGLDDIRILQVLQQLGNAQGLVADRVNAATVAWRENTALMKEARERFATTESQLLILANRLTKVGIEAFRNAEPGIKALIDATGDWITSNEQLLRSDLEGWLTGAAGAASSLVQSLPGIATSVENAAGSIKSTFDTVTGIWNSLPEDLRSVLIAGAAGRLILKSGGAGVGAYLANEASGGDPAATLAGGAAGFFSAAALKKLGSAAWSEISRGWATRGAATAAEAAAARSAATAAGTGLYAAGGAAPSVQAAVTAAAPSLTGTLVPIIGGAGTIIAFSVVPYAVATAKPASQAFKEAESAFAAEQERLNREPPGLRPSDFGPGDFRLARVRRATLTAAGANDAEIKARQSIEGGQSSLSDADLEYLDGLAKAQARKDAAGGGGPAEPNEEALARQREQLSAIVDLRGREVDFLEASGASIAQLREAEDRRYAASLAALNAEKEAGGLAEKQESLALEHKQRVLDLDRREQDASAAVLENDVARAQLAEKIASQKFEDAQAQGASQAELIQLAGNLEAAEKRTLEVLIAQKQARIDQLQATGGPAAASEIAGLAIEVEALNAEIARGPRHVKELTDSFVDLSDIVTSSLSDAITGIAIGTGKLSDLARRTGQTVAARFTEAFIKEKIGNFDLKFKANFLQDLPLIGKQSGTSVSNRFAEGFATGAAGDGSTITGIATSAGGGMSIDPSTVGYASLPDGQVAAYDATGSQVASGNPISQVAQAGSASSSAGAAGGSTGAAAAGAAAAIVAMVVAVTGAIQEAHRLRQQGGYTGNQIAKKGTRAGIESVGLPGFLGDIAYYGLSDVDKPFSARSLFSGMASGGLSYGLGAIVKALSQPKSEGVFVRKRLQKLLDEQGIPRVGSDIKQSRNDGPIVDLPGLGPVELDAIRRKDNVLGAGLTGGLGGGIGAAFTPLWLKSGIDDFGLNFAGGLSFRNFNAYGGGLDNLASLTGTYVNTDPKTGKPLDMGRGGPPPAEDVGRAVLTNAALMGLSFEDARNQVRRVNQSAAGGDFETGLNRLLAVRSQQLQALADGDKLMRRTRPSAGGAGGDDPTVDIPVTPEMIDAEFKNDLLSLIDSFTPLSDAIDKAKIATLAFNDAGQITIENLQQGIDDFTNAIGGVGDAFRTLIEGGSIEDAADDIGKSFADTVINRAIEEFLKTKLDPQFTAAIVDYEKGIEALLAGDSASAKAYFDRALAERQAATEDTVKVLNEIAPYLRDGTDLANLTDTTGSGKGGILYEPNFSDPTPYTPYGGAHGPDMTYGSAESDSSTYASSMQGQSDSVVGAIRALAASLGAYSERPVAADVKVLLDGRDITAAVTRADRLLHTAQPTSTPSSAGLA